ncbi:unnamed protein product, partial [Symbiodinium pilosum]
MASLARPIDIRLPATSAGAFCAFWDEEEGTWSTRGLVLLSIEDGINGPELLCQTTHLTLFGALLDTLVKVVRCSTASEVFSAKGFENLGKGNWLSYTYVPCIVSCSATSVAEILCFVPVPPVALVRHSPGYPDVFVK